MKIDHREIFRLRAPWYPCHDRRFISAARMEKAIVEVVNAVFVGPDGVLLARRSSPRKRYSDCRSFLGGRAEEGENSNDTLVRQSVETRRFSLAPDTQAACRLDSVTVSQLRSDEDACS